MKTSNSYSQSTNHAPRSFAVFLRIYDNKTTDSKFKRRGDKAEASRDKETHPNKLILPSRKLLSELPLWHLANYGNPSVSPSLWGFFIPKFFQNFKIIIQKKLTSKNVLFHQNHKFHYGLKIRLKNVHFIPLMPIFPYILYDSFSSLFRLAFLTKRSSWLQFSGTSLAAASIWEYERMRKYTHWVIHQYHSATQRRLSVCTWVMISIMILSKKFSKTRKIFISREATQSGVDQKMFFF